MSLCAVQEPREGLPRQRRPLHIPGSNRLTRRVRSGETLHPYPSLSALPVSVHKIELHERLACHISDHPTIIIRFHFDPGLRTRHWCLSTLMLLPSTLLTLLTSPKPCCLVLPKPISYQSLQADTLSSLQGLMQILLCAGGSSTFPNALPGTSAALVRSVILSGVSHDS